MSDEPLKMLLKRWPDQPARLELLRPARRPKPLGFGLSLDELDRLEAMIAEARGLLHEAPHRPAYEVSELKGRAAA